MKITTLLVYVISSSVLTMPAYGRVFKDTVQCSYQKLGKPPIMDKCIIEGASGQGYTIGKISWSDGVKNEFKGAWGSLNNWTIDGHEAKSIELSDDRTSIIKNCLQSKVSGIIICWWRNRSIENPVVSQNNIQNSQRLCIVDKNFEPNSKNFRTIKLYHYGIEVDIPSNYRSIKEQDGSVKILHPNYFALFQCISNGGKGGQGYESLDIHLVDRDTSISLKEQAALAVGYRTNIRGEKEPVDVEILNYQVGEIAGYIVNSRIGQSYVFTGLIRGSNKILQVSSNGAYKDFTNLLSRLRLIK
ncbi:MAG: hypothetical protein DCF19_02265 [Pseudanabaena frigida]|uniref:Uncharacterized protein n=1 Tax=Pseudanabaena frigida TaxID=945775 RepID=A0A2W4YB13_9CYAN|nr:MAG: hypothetical protein DCF19_02265 [Pseudanabaena frigida]